jgi:nitrate reductase alpha subunit
MHPFIHPLSAAVDPAWEARSDWEIYKGFAKKFSKSASEPGCREGSGAGIADPCTTPGEMAQPFGVQDWKRGRDAT